MAGKLIPLSEAAKMLGLEAEELSDMLSRGEIHGYRDGSSWKFKESEIERVKEELGAAAPVDDLIDLDDAGQDEATGSESLDGSSILVSEETLGKSSSTSGVIGGDDGESGEDSDIKLSSDTEGGSDLKLAGSDIGLSEGDSDVSLAADDQGSDVKLVPGDSDVVGDEDDFVTDSDVLAESGEQELGTSDTGRLSDAELAEDDDALELATGDSLALGDDDLLLEDDGSQLSAVDLEEEDEDDLVLSGSGIGSDVTLGAGDSGIGLANPSESGLDLADVELDLGGSAVDSLELPEDDDDDVIALEEEADPDAATQLKADDNFLLEPVEDGDEEDESGSQVIALEDSEQYDADAATMLGGEGDQALVAEADSDMFGQEIAAYGQQGAGGAAQPMAGPMPMPIHQPAAAMPEAGYSIWNVLALFCAMMFLMFGGLLMFDLVNNMWEAQGVGAGSTWIMDKVIEGFGL
jgi:excisionase family DNA binding protein